MLAGQSVGPRPVRRRGRQRRQLPQNGSHRTPATRRQPMPGHRIFATSFASIYPHYVAKAERKDHSKEEVDQVICWLTGYDDAGLEHVIAEDVDLETFFAAAPAMNPNASLVTGVICGMRVEEIDDPLMQQIRYMDKLVDGVAKGKKMTSILRGSTADA